MALATKKRDRVFGEFSDLKGVSGKLPAYHATSVSDAIASLRHHRAVTAAGDEGAITVWRDDAGLLRCDFQRYMVMLSEAQVKNLKELREWLREWWPKMRRD